jgi:hypothetical protein
MNYRVIVSQLRPEINKNLIKVQLNCLMLAHVTRVITFPVY